MFKPQANLRAVVPNRRVPFGALRVALSTNLSRYDDLERPSIVDWRLLAPMTPNLSISKATARYSLARGFFRRSEAAYANSPKMPAATS